VIRTFAAALGLWCLGWQAAAPAHATYTETIPGTKISFDMIAVPGGAFVMGSPANVTEASADGVKTQASARWRAVSER
jgi:hypothetical protein